MLTCRYMDLLSDEGLSPMTTSFTRQFGSMLPICLGCAGFTFTLPANSRAAGKQNDTMRLNALVFRTAIYEGGDYTRWGLILGHQQITTTSVNIDRAGHTLYHLLHHKINLFRVRLVSAYPCCELIVSYELIQLCCTSLHLKIVLSIV